MIGGSKIVAIIQARAGSTRLPSKVLLPLGDKPVIGHIIERAFSAKGIDEVWVATTTDAIDDETARVAEKFGAHVFRGDVDDVLDRYHGAALASKSDVIVRVTADDPLKDPLLIAAVAEAVVNEGLDYASNTLKPTFPEGLDVEAFTAEALERAWTDARLLSEREHVTPYIWKHPELFRLKNLVDSVDRSDMRWTLDYDDDYRFMQAIYAELYHGEIFSTAEVLSLLERRGDLAKLNSGRIRNEGYAKSISTEHPDIESEQP